MHQVQKVDLLPEGAQQNLPGIAAVLLADDAQHVGKIGRAQQRLAHRVVRQGSTRRGTQVEQRGRVDAPAGGVQDGVVAAGGLQRAVVHLPPEHDGGGGRHALAYLPVRSRRRALSSAWYSAMRTRKSIRARSCRGTKWLRLRYSSAARSRGRPPPPPGPHSPTRGGEHAGGPAPAGVGAQVLQHLRLAFESGHVLKVLQTQPLAVQRLYFGRQGAVLGLSPGHGSVPTIMENRVSTQRSLFFS